jgi:hypothetical protein
MLVKLVHFYIIEPQRPIAIIIDESLILAIVSRNQLQ